ncbi:MAG: glycosyltransferase family 4 protein [bacterium]|nr:glycosyltransferase family 4 protein [bacterium]
MHIGILAADLTHRHGWAHYSTSVIGALHQAGVRLTVLTTHDSPIPPALNGVPIYPILPTVDPLAGRMLPRLAALTPRAAGLLRSCDVIHTHVEPFAPLGGWASGRKPHIITGHGSYVRLDQAYSRAARPCYRWAFRRAAVACVSAYTAHAAAAALPGVRTQVIPNGVDAARFSPLPAAAKTGGTILTVGAVKPRKGTFELVQAFAQVRIAHPNAKLIVVGSLEIDPAYATRVRAEIERLHVADGVRLAGRIPEDMLRQEYAAADVFAFPSLADGWKFEGFGLAALEASAAGLPVAAFGGSGVEDAVIDSVTGRIVPPGAVSALAGALIDLLADKALRARLGEAGRAHAAAMTWEAAAAALIRLYASAARAR